MKNSQRIKNNKGIFGVIGGSLLVSIPAISLVSIAMPVAQLNPCSSISSEAPYNRGSAGTLEENCMAITPSTAPLPEEQQPPSATVVPVNGAVNIRLVNQTNTVVTYQVVGDTTPRTLSGNSDVLLQTLEIPVTVTFRRPDGGLLLVRPQAPTAGRLEVTLTETLDLGTDKRAMMIEETGDVFLN